MKLPNRIIAASLAAGYIFTPILGLMAYTILSADQRADILYRLSNDPKTLGVVFFTITLFWFLVGSIAARLTMQRIDDSMVSVRRRVQEAFITRRQVDKQRDFIAQFAERVRPVASRIVGYAGEISSHSHQLTEHMARTSEAIAGTREVHDLLASSDELSGEIEKSNEDTRVSNAHLETAAFTLDALRQNIPSLKQQIVALDALTRQLNLLALNASIETSRPGSNTFSIVAGEIKTLGQQAAEATHNLQQQLAGIENFTIRSLAALDPLIANLRQLSAAFATLKALADGQWRAAERLANKTDKACALAAPEALAGKNHRLLDVVQVMSEQTALLQHSVENLNLRLKSVA